MKCGESYETLWTGKDDGGVKSGHNDKGTPVEGGFEINGPMGVGGEAPKGPKSGPIKKYKG